MKRTVAASSVLAFVLVVSVARADGSWRQDAIWDDGNAEFCAYDVSWRRYGNLFPGTSLLVTVKEPWAPDLEVKADRARDGGFEVLKLNHIRDVGTGIYTYHQMASSFIRRDNGKLRKLSVTSSEGCGISTAQVVGNELNTRSYFDGQGERTQRFPPGAWPEDALPAMLREFVSGSLPASVAVFPSLMAGRFASLEPAELSVRRTEGVSADVPAGVFEATRIDLQAGESTLSYWFDSASPHKLVRFVHSDGTEYSLAKCERIPYWKMNRPGGEDWLPKSFR